MAWSFLSLYSIEISAFSKSFENRGGGGQLLHPKLCWALCIRSAFLQKTSQSPKSLQWVRGANIDWVWSQIPVNSSWLATAVTVLFSITDSCSKTYIHSTSTLQISSGKSYSKTSFQNWLVGPHKTCKLSQAGTVMCTCSPSYRDRKTTWVQERDGNLDRIALMCMPVFWKLFLIHKKIAFSSVWMQLNPEHSFFRIYF